VDREVAEARFVAGDLLDLLAGAVELAGVDGGHPGAALADEILALAVAGQCV
jgi:hypothetical protein